MKKRATKRTGTLVKAYYLIYAAPNNTDKVNINKL